jgi:hypothetical protein
LEEWNPHRVNGRFWDSTFYPICSGLKVIPPRPNNDEIKNTGARRKEKKIILEEESIQTIESKYDIKNHVTSEICYRIITLHDGREQIEPIGLIQYPHGLVLEQVI